MADVKNLRASIRSVDAMLHLTTAMGLVASSKMHRAGETMHHTREYAEALRRLTMQLSTCPECHSSRFLHPQEEGRTALVVIAGDRGLCGGYNNNVFRLADPYVDAERIPIGKRAAERYGGECMPCESFSSADGDALAKRLFEGYCQGAYNRIGVISSRYVSLMTQETCVEWLLPLPPSEEALPGSVLLEPSAEQVFHAAVREYLTGALMACVRESFACETAARRMAMDNAARNAREMQGELRLTYNRLRQGAITQEITEIVAGSGN